MATTLMSLETALEHHRAGRLQLAEQGYRQILEHDPHQAQALGLLGALASQGGRNDVATEYLRRAIELQPAVPEFHNNLAFVLKSQGLLERAAASYRRAVELKPDYAGAHNDLGIVLKDLGRVPEALASYRRALEINPDYAQAHHNLGTALRDDGQIDAARDCFQRALALRPDLSETHNALGVAWQQQGNFAAARECYQRAVELQPANAEAHNNLGSALAECGQREAAIASIRRALELHPDFADAHYNLGNLLMEQGQFEAAAASFRRAVELRSDYFEAQLNLGNVLRMLGDLEAACALSRSALELRPQSALAHNGLGTVYHDQGLHAAALDCYRLAAELQPDCAEAHTNLGLALLLLGDWPQAWPKYEWRLRLGKRTPRQFVNRPAWSGEPLAGKTILLHCEQGFGDAIQFVRYAALVRNLGARTIVECTPALKPLLSSCAGIDELVSCGSPLPEFDVHAPLLSVPGILGTTPDTIPADVPYLQADSRLVEHWRQKLADIPGLKVGICWQGNFSFTLDRIRSVPLRQFAPLARCPGVSLLSLQKGTGSEQRHELDRQLAEQDRFSVIDLGSEFDATSGAFMDTAAVMQNLDLVITVDTAIAHLAGALGVPVWVAIPHIPDWRWLLDRDDSPWYPSLQLYRQPRVGDWGAVFERMARVLAEASS